MQRHLAALEATSFAKVKIIKWVPDVDLKALNLGPGVEDLPRKNGQVVPPKEKPGPLPCVRGTDYGQPCPAGWQEVGGECKAPEGFDFTSQCLAKTAGKNVISSDLPKDEKRSVEVQCGAPWPCTNGSEGLQPNYEEICPVHWSFQQDGSCMARASYDGPCKRIQNFLMFTPGMKATWAANCDVSWPLAPAPAPGVPKPRPPRSAPSEAIWAKCGHNYKLECPWGFGYDSKGMCHAHENYEGKGISLCSHFDTHRWTEGMKEAFEKSCRVQWPCDGEAFVYRSGLLLGLAFL